MIFRSIVIVCFGLCSYVNSAHAQQSVMERLKTGGTVVIAYRESSIPFSYLDANKRPVGYAIELCLNLIEAARKKTGSKSIAIDYLAVTPSTRIDAIMQGRADLECGSTTNNSERRMKVAFTVPHYITGARILVRSDSKIEQLDEMRGMTLVSTKGSTPLKIVQSANQERLIGIKILEAPDHSRAVEMVERSEADGFVMDDVLLYGLRANRPNPLTLKVVGRFITIEPLAIMLSKNEPEFKKIVDDEMKRLINSREIYPIYNKWFMSPVPPKSAVLNLPPSYLLKDFWKYPTDIVPF